MLGILRKRAEGSGCRSSFFDFTPMWYHPHDRAIINLPARPLYSGNDWPRCDVLMSDDKTAYIIRADVPGVDASGKWNSQRIQQQQEDWAFFERKRGEFVRRFSLPVNANTDAMTATTSLGVLTVRIPVLSEEKEISPQQKDEDKFREIPIEIETAD
ncbi:MAG: hypothetical protein MHM6MM_006521 [Cercozoa sp. M6MM]